MSAATLVAGWLPGCLAASDRSLWLTLADDRILFVVSVPAAADGAAHLGSHLHSHSSNQVQGRDDHERLAKPPTRAEPIVAHPSLPPCPLFSARVRRRFRRSAGTLPLPCCWPSESCSPQTVSPTRGQTAAGDQRARSSREETAAKGRRSLMITCTSLFRWCALACSVTRTSWGSRDVIV